MRGVSIFRLRTVEKVELDCGWVVAGYETHRVLSSDLDTSSDALDNQIGPLVWPLRCFEVIKPKPQKTEIWEIPVFSFSIFFLFLCFITLNHNGQTDGLIWLSKASEGKLRS